MFNSFGRPITVLVQGASGGLGREFVRQCSVEPAVQQLFAACREPQALQADLVAKGKAHEKVEWLQMDLEQEESIVLVAQDLSDRKVRLDLVVNCSGVLHESASQPASQLASPSVLQPEKSLGQISKDSMAKAFAVNATGPLLIAKHLIGLMPRTQRSVFASLSARVGSISDNRLGGWYSYRASKAALNMLHRTLSVELSRTHPGCLCVVLHPGTVDTPLSEPFQARVPEDQLFSPAVAARQLLRVIDQLDASQSGSFLAWDGSEIPW